MRAQRLTTVAVAVLAIVLAGCSLGQKSRDNTLLPSLRLAADGIENDAANGVAALAPAEQASAAEQVAAFFAAFRADPPGDETQLLWPTVAALCETGFNARIAAGSIGPGVAESLRERVRRFEEGLSTYFGKE